MNCVNNIDCPVGESCINGICINTEEYFKNTVEQQVYFPGLLESVISPYIYGDESTHIEERIRITIRDDNINRLIPLLTNRMLLDLAWNYSVVERHNYRLAMTSILPRAREVLSEEEFRGFFSHYVINGPIYLIDYITPDLVNMTNEELETLLFLNIYDDRERNILINRGADINIENIEGDTVLSQVLDSHIQSYYADLDYDYTSPVIDITNWILNNGYTNFNAIQPYIPNILDIIDENLSEDPSEIDGWSVSLLEIMDLLLERGLILDNEDMTQFQNLRQYYEDFL